MNDEMRQAVNGGTERPKANWVFEFSSFGDVIDVLEVQMNLLTDIDEAVLRYNLRDEMVENLSLCSSKFNGEIFPAYKCADSTVEFLSKNPGEISAVSLIPYRCVQRLMMCMKMAHGYGRFNHTFFSIEALKRGIFLEYDRDIDGFVTTPPHEILKKVVNLTQKYDSMLSFGDEQATKIVLEHQGMSPETKISVNNVILYALLISAESNFNIIHWLSYLIRILSVGEFEYTEIENPYLLPFNGERSKLESETISKEDAYEWAMNQVL